MPLQQATRQQGKAGVNLTGANAGGLAPQRGPAPAQQWGPSGFKPHQAAKPLPKLVAPKLLSVSAWLQASMHG